MAELQLLNQQDYDCNFVIDDILSEDKEISFDDTHPKTQITKFLYAFRFIEREIKKLKLNADNMIAEISNWTMWKLLMLIYTLKKLLLI